jgi:peptidoglycan pentaglycine glycine transferase (the first glycine)
VAPEAWDPTLLALPHAHLLQSQLWGDFKRRYGWSPTRWEWRPADSPPVAAAQVLRRAWPNRLGSAAFSVVYVPRGPVVDTTDPALVARVLADLATLAEAPGVLSIQIEPDWEQSPQLEDLLTAAGWFRSNQPVQFGSTMILDLRPDEEALLAGMKAKTRYNIRLAERRGVVVRPGSADDLNLLYDLYAETSVRDGFVIRERSYYQRAWGDFLEAGLAHAFVATAEDLAVAGLVAYRFGDRAWFLYGMSSDRHRDRMPNHALQWATIRWARASGCTTYDLWGAPDTPDPDDPLYGVYRFKEGFGARHLRLIGSWEFTARPAFHRLFRLTLPRILGVMRRRQQGRTRQLLDPAG